MRRRAVEKECVALGPKPEHRVHPLLIGLVSALPDEGEEWSREDVDAWLALAKSIFEVIYMMEDVPA